MTPNRPGVTRPNVTPNRPNATPNRPGVTRPNVTPNRPNVTPTRPGVNRPNVTPNRPGATRPNVTPNRPGVNRPNVSPNRPKVVPNRLSGNRTPSKPATKFDPTKKAGPNNRPPKKVSPVQTGKGKSGPLKGGGKNKTIPPQTIPVQKQNQTTINNLNQIFKNVVLPVAVIAATAAIIGNLVANTGGGGRFPSFIIPPGGDIPGGGGALTLGGDPSPCPLAWVPNDPDNIDAGGVCLGIDPNTISAGDGSDAGVGDASVGGDAAADFTPIVQDERTLRVCNDTAQPVTLYVQYRAKDESDQWVWLPAEPGADEAITVELAPGEATDLADDNRPMAASRVRIWGKAAKGNWETFKDRDLWLVEQNPDTGNRTYTSPQVQTFVYTVKGK